MKQKNKKEIVPISELFEEAKASHTAVGTLAKLLREAGDLSGKRKVILREAISKHFAKAFKRNQVISRALQSHYLQADADEINKSLSDLLIEGICLVLFEGQDATIEFVRACSVFLLTEEFFPACESLGLGIKIIFAPGENCHCCTISRSV